LVPSRLLDDDSRCLAYPGVATLVVLPAVAPLSMIYVAHTPIGHAYSAFSADRMNLSLTRFTNSTWIRLTEEFQLHFT
jgi:hypothetical protein